MKQVKKFIPGLVGGVVGASLLLGGNYLINGNSSTGSSSSTTGTTKVSNVSYKVSSTVTEAVAKVSPAVVSVINLQSTQSSNSMDSIFGQQGSDDSSSSGDLEAASEGSGVIYKKSGDKAYVVTNNHVVESQEGLEILLADGTKVTGKLVGTDSYTDLAVIEIPADKVTTVAEFGDSDKLTVGEPAIAIGSPLGSEYANSVTEGIVSSLNRNVVSTNESNETVNINAIQTDAAINPGNSGGPLVNISGQVIGINSSKIASSSTSSSVSVEGMGFAIPSNDVVSIINQLEENGEVERPALGVQLVNLSDLSSQQIEQYLKTPDTVTSGAVLASVSSATPAEEAGLKQYDVIVAVDDDEVTSVTDLQSALYKHKVGDEIKITYYRGDKKSTVTVKLTLNTKSLQNK
ncbi:MULTISPECIES: trypsin-like peptidase domain-containing protein [unclassified Enterococcus]|uniref:S1C family serine protease n=1 Tax=unclassified Enterococcus TaxID=2608891 RepID=UPI0015540C3F|nr:MULTISPECIES: trypsin-like peptidase domain-containing protein [unclassified Enterococcus]MBS7577504.1 trypsin-like peptidase domain-containing protein [Enterococcus sp. MMGLQ5-2]MBS7584997.1 trypsin-like peptidase domain-containing protein [Enterococcus sp. MMGLQ5-1]NPD12852.1 PDZ domain-containing protein [Enterococcus sp. MMGLQ5-1]NPD37337.1 PDZ domain-containing protein [Enterococcus sp. MMGLQ5-2]